MTDRPDFETSSIDLDAFHDWVDRIAEAEGTSPDAIIQQLMSTYWILNELTETLEETPYEHLLEGESVGEPGRDDAADTDDGESGYTKSEIVDVIRAIAELNNEPAPPQPERSGGSIDPRLVDLIEAIHRHSDVQQSPGTDPAVARLTDKFDRLHEDVSSLDREIDDVDDTTGELASRLESVEERHERELSDLAETVAYIEDALSERAHRDRLEDLESRVDAKHEATSERVDSIDQTFEAAYADIKKILGHLLDSSAEHDATLDVLVDAHESDLDRLLAAHEDATRLRQLQSDANRQGISTAICDACEESFDVSLLAEPRCPHCGRDVGRFDTKSSFWRTKHVAKPPEHRPRESEPTIRERIRDSVETSGSRGGPADSGVRGRRRDGDD